MLIEMSKSRLKSRRRNEQGSKWARTIIAILATIGVIDTGSITLNKWGWIGSLACPGGSNGCDKVLNSAWGTIFSSNAIEIPLSLIGFVSYLTVLVLSILPFLIGLSDKKKSIAKTTWWGLFLTSNGMAIFSFLLIGIMLFKIEAFCFFCILSAVISISILILTIIGGTWDDPRDLMFKGFLLSIVVLLGGLIWSSSVDPSKSSDVLTTNESNVHIVASKSTPASIDLARHLTKIGAVNYSAYWCPHCHEQQEMFGKEAVSNLKLVECAIDGKDSQADLCKAKDIQGFPSWEINGKIDSGVKSLEELADLSGYKGSREF